MNSEPQAFLDRGASFEGKVSFSGTLRIEGHLRGTARSDGTLVVGEAGLVQAEIQVGTLLVRGTVVGTVHARARVVIASTGRVEGEVVTPLLSVEEGGEIKARVKSSPVIAGSLSGLTASEARLAGRHAYAVPSVPLEAPEAPAKPAARP
jgi:cytoskeletal protein CcmA (bactofilin family)